MGVRALENHRELLRLQAQRDVLLAAVARNEEMAAAARSQGPPPYLQDALAIAAMASFDVPGILTTLERARIEGVRVAVLDVSAEQRRAQMEIEIANMEVLVRYLAMLNDDAPTGMGWRLERAQRAASGALGRATLVLEVRGR